MSEAHVRQRRQRDECPRSVQIRCRMHQARYMVAARSRDKTPETDSSLACALLLFAPARRRLESRKGNVSVGYGHYAVDRQLETLSHYNDPACGEQSDAATPELISARPVAFRSVAGEAWLTSYDSAEGARRSFCRWCGPSMPVSSRDTVAMLLPLASLNMPVARSRAVDAAELMPA
jgi:hypothetical protein